MSTKRKVLIIFVLACILLIPSTVALAKKQPVYFNPQLGIDTYVTSNDEVVIRASWYACSKGLVNDYIDSVTLLFYVNGTELKNIRENNEHYWSTPTEYSDGSGSVCLWDVDKLWVAHWEYSLGKLEPGDYRVWTHQSHAFPVIDGVDFVEPFGELDVYDYVKIYDPVTIHVVP